MEPSPRGGVSHDELRFFLTQFRAAMVIEHRTSGVVTLVQERRFQLVDDSGRAHLFLLAHDAPDGVQLAPLAGSERRVTVSYRHAPGLLAHLAVAVFVNDAEVMHETHTP